MRAHTSTRPVEPPSVEPPAHMYLSLAEVDVAPRDRDRLADPESRVREKLDERPPSRPALLERVRGECREQRGELVSALT